ncbi:hypothetical protein J4434_02995 [Candidatus Woesearchaeota archaeon]|nr:hypothetical protein [Candidatus Woesearchaeota archaeon]
MADDRNSKSSIDDKMDDKKVNLGFKYLIATCDMDDLLLDPNRSDETTHSVHQEFKTENERDGVYDIYVMGKN